MRSVLSLRRPAGQLGNPRSFGLTIGKQALGGTFWGVLALAVLFSSVAAPGSAQLRTWQFDALFSDGGRADGFLLVGRSGTIFDWHLEVKGGNTQKFPPIQYTSATSTMGGGTGTRFFFQHDGSTRQIRLNPVVVLDEFAEAVPLGLSDPTSAVECFDCGPAREMIWALLHVEKPGNSCSPGPFTLCLDDEAGDRRFRVEVSYESVLGGGISGNAIATPLSILGVAKGGVFSFTDPANPEILVKVLKGCAINQHHWIFFAATTTVGFVLEVVDLAKNTSRVYTNKDLMTAEPITDTGAFACP